VLDGEPGREDAAHGLRHDVACARGQPCEDPAVEVVERIDRRVPRDAAEPGPGEAMGRTDVGESRGDRLPEGGSAGSSIGVRGSMVTRNRLQEDTIGVR
jgi:hypothetical protein